MNYSYNSLQINIHKVDGSMVTITQSDAALANRTLNEFHPTRIFNEEGIATSCSHSVAKFNLSSITRVDLITDQLSVWDFPFVLGALMELTEGEFHGIVHERLRWMQPCPPGDLPVFFDVEMVNGRHSYLWMAVIAGFSAARLSEAFSQLRTRSLIFALHAGGVGVLNPANIVRFTVHPHPQQESAKVWHTREIGDSEFESHARDWGGLARDGQPLSRFPWNGRHISLHLPRNQNENESQMERKHQ